MDSMNKNNKTYIWIAVGCLGLLVCILAVIVFGFGGLMWIGAQTPENAAVQVNAPINVKVNESIEISVTITNTGAETMKLASIDLSLNYLNGFIVKQASPPFTETYQYTVPVSGEKVQTFVFDQSIAPGDTLVVVFNGESVLSGDFSGDVYVCVDSGFNCAVITTRTVVK